ncbi:MAG: SHOCT domain-containing protein [Nitrosotalea sp.]
MAYLQKNNRIQKNEASKYSSGALEILKIRLAKGDITREEFNKLKNDVV